MNTIAMVFGYALFIIAGIPLLVWFLLMILTSLTYQWGDQARKLYHYLDGGRKGSMMSRDEVYDAIQNSTKTQCNDSRWLICVGCAADEISRILREKNPDGIK